MQKVTVYFINVGPQKLSWSADVVLDARELTTEIHRRGALGSRGIDFADNGGIYVGGLRRVGTWSLEKPPADDAVDPAGDRDHDTSTRV